MRAIYAQTPGISRAAVFDPLIPVKAGIQMMTKNNPSHNQASIERTLSLTIWVPAFAGMSGGRTSASLYVLEIDHARRGLQGAAHGGVERIATGDAHLDLPPAVEPGDQHYLPAPLRPPALQPLGQGRNIR